MNKRTEFIEALTKLVEASFASGHAIARQTFDDTLGQKAKDAKDRVMALYDEAHPITSPSEK